MAQKAWNVPVLLLGDVGQADVDVLGQGDLNHLALTSPHPVLRSHNAVLTQEASYRCRRLWVMFGQHWVRVHLKHKASGAQSIKTVALEDWKRQRPQLETEGAYQVLLVAPVHDTLNG